MTGSHRWEDMLPEEFYEEFERAPIAYWACGAMEEHGLHNALGTDYVQCYGVCLRAVEITGGIVFPPVPLAPAGVPGFSRQELRSGAFQTYPPSLWVSREACETVYTELLESMADLGFRACAALGGHYPADLLLQEIHERTNGRVGSMAFWGGGTVSLLKDDFLPKLRQRDPLADGHGTFWETSLVMAIRPDWVDLSRLPNLERSPLPSQLRANRSEVYAHIADANPELGQQVLQAAVDSLVAKVRMPLAQADASDRECSPC